ncbi:MAG: type II toxin-antitoxin system Phd/YefM family antitoxin [Pyrinomonadaceae bacterium]|nr:type II toxin-antitoxin system Phd/YefM family antitoxin [Pyrinomonadaceae bacterium]
MYQISVEEAKTIQLPDLLDSVAKGQEIIFTQNNQPIAKLTSIAQTKPRPQFGSAKGLITFADDFNEPIEDFADYLK